MLRTIAAVSSVVQTSSFFEVVTAETVSMEEMDAMDCQVPKDLRGLQGNLVPPVDPQGHKGRLELGGHLDRVEL